MPYEVTCGFKMNIATVQGDNILTTSKYLCEKC